MLLLTGRGTHFGPRRVAGHSCWLAGMQGWGRGAARIFIVIIIIVIMMMMMMMMMMEKGAPSTGRGVSLLSTFRSGSRHWL